MDGLHLTTAHTPVDTRIFDKEAMTLAESGFDIGIMAHDPPEQTRNGVDFYDLGTASTRVERWKSLYQVAQRAKQLDASIYHFHDPELIPVGLYLSSATDNSVIYDVHENYGHIATTREWIPKPVAPILSYSIPRLERLAAAQFDAIVGTSEWKVEPFVDVNENTTTVHNFPKIDSLPKPTASIERTSNHVLCYVGGLVDVRGIYRMLQLLDLLVKRGLDVELWALGSWKPDTDQNRVNRIISQRGLETNVRFPGYLAYEEMFQYLYSADIGLALLDVEHYRYNIPTKFFEYLYAGLPIVTTPVNAVKDFLPEQYCRVVPEDNMGTAADAVETALETTYETTEMRTLVEEKYSWGTEANSLVSLYDSLL